MSRRRLSINHLDVFNSADLLSEGLFLGDRGIGPGGAWFVMTETSGDLTKGMILINLNRYSQTQLAITTASDLLSFSIADAGAIVAENDWAGKLMYVSDDENLDNALYVESNEAGINGAQAMNVTFMEALTAAPQTNEDVIIVDSNYVVKSTTNGGDELLVIGICPKTVDQSVAPFFWRQVSGYAPVLAGAVIPVDAPLATGDPTAGTAAEAVEAAADETRIFGSVQVANTAGDKHLIARLHGVLS